MGEVLFHPLWPGPTEVEAEPRGSAPAAVPCPREVPQASAAGNSNPLHVASGLVSH